MINNIGRKVGLVTLYSDNFGSCLQAYALFYCIKKMGYSPVIIKYRRSGLSTDKSLFRKIRHLPIKTLWYLLVYRKNIQRRKACFNIFRSSVFVFTEREYMDNDEKRELNEQFDAFVCGSDMMWCEAFEKDWEQFFLRFADGSKRIAYAPSFGINKISEKNYQRCLEFLSGFPSSRLSCRDITGVRMIKDVFGLSAQHALDPTMLLDKYEWNKLLQNDNRYISQKYTLAYLFGGVDGNRKKIFEEVNSWNVGELKFIDGRGKHRVKGNVGPWEFVRLFRDAEFIVTDTFHGLMFSLIFEKPFVVLTREDGVHWIKYSDRITSTLEMLNITERYLDMNKCIPNDFKELDYTSIKSILSAKRTESITYLQNAIEEVFNNLNSKI